jgi:hypothetical protein
LPLPIKEEDIARGGSPKRGFIIVTVDVLQYHMREEPLIPAIGHLFHCGYKLS